MPGRQSRERFSLVAEIGWLASNELLTTSDLLPGFSLVAEIGWLARYPTTGDNAHRIDTFQSRCRDWVVGEIRYGQFQ